MKQNPHAQSEADKARYTPNFQGRTPRIKNTPARIKSKGFDLNRISSTKLKKWAAKLGLKVLLLLLFFAPQVQAQQPSLYLDFPDTTCTTLLTFEDDSCELAQLGYRLEEEFITIGVDTFDGFWLHERFYVPDRGIVLTIMDCGVVFDYVPHFGIQEPILIDQPKWITRPSHKASAGLFFLSIGTSFVAGYCGGQAEHLRAVNGVKIENWDAFHINRNASLWLAGSTGISLTLSLTKDPSFRWWHVPYKIGICAVGYAVGAELGYKLD